MGKDRPHGPKRLIVEGIDDRHSVIGLMRAHVDWPRDLAKVPVFIEIGGGTEEILEPGYLTGKIKEAGVQIVGVMIDADTKPRSRYANIRDMCSAMFPTLPDDLPPSGVVVENEDGSRFGAWIMPDNTSEGSLETFLRFLVKGEDRGIWQHAINSVNAAKQMGAKCRGCHDPKAHLYTWLAWQDPPSQSPGIALTQKILDPHSESAAGFVDWFRRLYKL